MELNENRKAAFLLLKGVCNSIIRNPCKEHPEQLKQVLNVVGNVFVTEFAEYILYPIKFHIFNKDLDKRDDKTCILLECLSQIIPHLQLVDKAFFLDIYSVICCSLVKCLGQPQTNLSGCSEELKVRVLESARILFEGAPKSTLSALYQDKEFYSKLCVLIYNSLQFASKEKSTTLRCLSLKCLLIYCRLVTMEEGGDADKEVAKVVRKCLPGIITECKSIVLEGSAQNHRITMLTLKLWSRSVSLVMADSHRLNEKGGRVKELAGKFSAKKLTGMEEEEELDSAKRDKELLKKGELSTEWLSAVAKRLTSATEAFTLLKLHPHSRVRTELVSSISFILSYAPRNMSPSLGSFLDALIVLSEDTESSVAEVSKAALEGLRQRWGDLRGRHLIEDVKECFCNLLSRLPRILHSSDERLKESDMALLSGYILLLGPENFADFVTSQQLLDKVIHCLLVAAALDTSSPGLLDQASLSEPAQGWSEANVPWRQFSICSSPRLVAQLGRACRLLSSMPNLVDMAFAFLEIFNSSPLRRLEITLCINDILLSSEHVSDKKYSHIVKTIVNEYLEPYFWEAQPVLVLSESKKLITQTCLCIEGVGKLARVIGGAHFSGYLLKSLYPLLEYAGSPYACVALAGMRALSEVGAAYGGDVGSLVESNTDYLTHHITLNLRRGGREAGSALLVLSAVLRFASPQDSGLPPLLDVVNSVLLESFDKVQSANLAPYLEVFKSFLEFLQAQVRGVGGDTVSSPVLEKVSPSLITLLLDHQKALRESTSFHLSPEDKEWEDEEGKEAAHEEDEKDGEEEKKVVPAHVKLTEAIVLRSCHLLPSKDLSIQISIIQILEKGVLILAQEEDILLPAVHRIWSPLVERFNPSKDPLLIRNAYRLLTALALTAGPFIRQRTVKEVMPRICSMLERLSTDSLRNVKKCNGTAGLSFTQSYRLQEDVLSKLGNLAVSLDLEGVDLHRILTSCQPYLSRNQPSALQECCRDVYRKLWTLNRGMVWLHLMSICPRQEYLTPTASFQATYQMQTKKENDHFTSNVDALLVEMSS